MQKYLADGIAWAVVHGACRFDGDPIKVFPRAFSIRWFERGLIMNILRYPHGSLSAPCRAVQFPMGSEERALLAWQINEMVEAMYMNNGVGLAAPQLGFCNNVIVVDPSNGNSSLQLITMINPTIVWSSIEQNSADEGCLSIPGVTVSVSRFNSIDVMYLDTDGGSKQLRCDGILARIVQHEVDHLFGITMLDKAGPVTRQWALKNYPIVSSETMDKR